MAFLQAWSASAQPIINELPATKSWSATASAGEFVSAWYGPSQNIFAVLPDPSRIGREVIIPALVSSIDTGVVQRRAKGQPRRRWRLQFRKDEVDADAVWNAYVQCGGAFRSFHFRCPFDGETYRVRFEQDDLTRDVLWRAVYNFGLTLIEVI